METSHPGSHPELGRGLSRFLLRVLDEIRPPHFSSQEEAAEFRAHKARKVIYVRRFAVATSPAFWLLFSYWDIYNLYGNFGWILGVRIVAALFLLGVSLLTFHKAFFREAFAEGVLLAAVTVAWMSALVMSQLAPPPASYVDYVTAFPMVLFFLFTVLWVDPKRATILGILLIIAYAVSMLVIWQTLPGGLVRPDRSFRDDFIFHSQASTSYLASVVILGSLVSHQLEGYLRREFIQQKALRAEKQRTELLNRELQDRIEHIEEMNAHQQRQAEALLELKEEQRRLAVEANRKKSTFLAAATHDLRQPLTALQAIVEALDQSLALGNLDSAKEHMALTRRSSRAMRTTLNAVLEISRLESGVVEPDYATFDLGRLVQDVYSQYATSATDKGLDFRCCIPSDEPILVRSDRVLLTRLITNLVSNAIKYTPARPDRRSGVVIGIVRFGTRGRVDVFDTGVGIDKSHRAAIFEPFVQLGNRERDREKGLGLGLSIVRQIADLLEQHRLDFRSIPGRGSRFSVDIPIAPPGALDLETLDPTERSPQAQSLRGAYVLLVEDDSLVRRTVQAMLESWGCLVEACADLEGVDAFLKSAERVPDVVLTDFRLPDDRTAHDVISAIEAEFRRPLPVVVMTGELSVLREELSKSVTEVVPKPPDHQALRKAIAASVRRSSEGSSP